MGDWDDIVGCGRGDPPAYWFDDDDSWQQDDDLLRRIPIKVNKDNARLISLEFDLALHILYLYQTQYPEHNYVLRRYNGSDESLFNSFIIHLKTSNINGDDDYYDLYKLSRLMPSCFSYESFVSKDQDKYKIIDVNYLPYFLCKEGKYLDPHMIFIELQDLL